VAFILYHLEQHGQNITGILEEDVSRTYVRHKIWRCGAGRSSYRFVHFIELFLLLFRYHPLFALSSCFYPLECYGQTSIMLVIKAGACTGGASLPASAFSLLLFLDFGVLVCYQCRDKNLLRDWSNILSIQVRCELLVLHV
jgi:hypothetical protein